MHNKARTTTGQWQMLRRSARPLRDSVVLAGSARPDLASSGSGRITWLSLYVLRYMLIEPKPISIAVFSHQCFMYAYTYDVYILHVHVWVKGGTRVAAAVQCDPGCGTGDNKQQVQPAGRGHA